MSNEESILSSVKRGIGGLTDEYTVFDHEIIVHVNTLFSILCQLGVGPANGFSISGYREKWSDFNTDNDNRLNMVKDYIILKVKLLFDHTLGPSTIESLNRLISELEWRLNVVVDPGETIVSN